METSLPDMEMLKRSRENRLKEMEIEAILKECMTYLFFILVLYFIAYQDKDKRSFLFSQNLQTRFFQGDPAFGNVRKTRGSSSGLFLPHLYLFYSILFYLFYFIPNTAHPNKTRLNLIYCLF